MSTVTSNSTSMQGATAARTAAPAATEDEAVSYTSSVVQLPPTVPELIKCLEQQHERCAQLTRCLQRVHAETIQLVASNAGTPARERYSALSAVAADGNAKSNTSLAGSSLRASTPPPPASSASPAQPAAAVNSIPAVVVARGVVATSTTGTGTALTGKVMSAAGMSPTTTTAVRAVVVTAESATVRPSVSPDAMPGKASASTTAMASSTPATALSSEQVAELRLRVVALETTQQLLTSSQSELRTTQTALARERELLETALTDLAQLRKEVLANTTEASSSLPQADNTPVSAAHHLADMQTRLAAREAEVHAARLRHESAVYELTQLQERISIMTREKAFLQETNTHLEGQLQRLLTSSMAVAPQSASRSKVPAAAAPRLTASEAYQKEALEKQINDLRVMTDKLTRDLRKQTARRAKAEEMAQALQKENTELKASALLYRRQVNESELELEWTISRREDDERLRKLERDTNCLRSALRDRTDQYQREKMEWEQQLLTLSRQVRVHVAAAKQLLKRVLVYQVREVVWQQCRHAGTQLSRRHAAGTTSSGSCSSNGAPKPGIPTTTAASASPSPPSSRVEDATATTLRADLPSPSAPSSLVLGAAADTAMLVDRERQLEELKHTFERRVALMEAQHKAETQQLLALNKELRQALTVSQDDLTEKTRLLEAAQRRSPPSVAVPLCSTHDPPTTTSQRSSISSGWREMPTTLVCRTVGEDGPAVGALGVLDKGDLHPSTHTLSAAPPRQVTDVERRYNPEHMPTWEAVQVENEALLDRLTTMQEEKWKLTTVIEDLQQQCGALKGELQRNASTMNQLLTAGMLTPSAATRGNDEGQLRVLQCLLQETLKAKFELEERLQAAARKF
ncbi:hypothetical protein Q4I30_004510 [Leishmania utingensis]|uniref:Uncharacterized protein n=1 Tax=Leishmania utingensis TaxID=653362 RepID=A0AAW3AFB0_9TRYP